MTFLFVLSMVLLAILATKLITFVTLSRRHQASQVRNAMLERARTPLVSVMVPCYNEELGVCPDFG